MRNKTVTISVKTLWYLFTALALSIICVGGYSPYFMNIRTYLGIALAAGAVFTALFVRRRVILNASLALFAVVAVYMLFSAANSLDPDTGLKIAGYYVVGVLFMMIEYSERQINLVLNFFTLFVMIIAVSIIISVFIDDCMNKYFSWFLNPTNSAGVAQSMRDTIKNSHSYAGLAREKGIAAYIMGMGLCVVLARMFSGGKIRWQDVLCLLVEGAALLLTSKRMILICLVLVFCVLMLMSKIKGKIMKFAVCLLIAAVLLFIVMAYIPSMSNVFYRFINETDDTLTGRDQLWAFSLMMFAKSPAFGMGLGAFNDFTANQGYVSTKGDKWSAYGHNCYYEFLGEIGVVGCIIVFGAILYMVVKTFRLANRSDLSLTERCHTLFALAVEIMLLAYAVTGNVLLYQDQTLSLFFAFAIVRSISARHSVKSPSALSLRQRLSGKSRLAPHTGSPHRA